jgi:hypothetical protein
MADAPVDPEAREKWLMRGIENGWCSYDWCRLHDDGHGKKCMIVTQLFGTCHDRQTN